MVRKTFDALVRALRKNGPMTVVTSKTRITFMVRMRFGGVTPRKKSLPGGFALMGPARHPLLRPSVRYGRTYGHRFQLTHPKQIDASFRGCWRRRIGWAARNTCKGNSPQRRRGGTQRRRMDELPLATEMKLKEMPGANNMMPSPQAPAWGNLGTASPGARALRLRSGQAPGLGAKERVHVLRG